MGVLCVSGVMSVYKWVSVFWVSWVFEIFGGFFLGFFCTFENILTSVLGVLDVSDVLLGVLGFSGVLCVDGVFRIEAWLPGGFGCNIRVLGFRV